MRVPGSAGWRSIARTLALIGALWLAGGAAFAAQADDERALLERRVKAAFIYQFLNYIEWPEATFPNASMPVTMAVVGDDELAAELTKIVATRTMSGRSLLVPNSKIAESFAGVHLLFVGRAEMGTLPHWVKMARSRPILIITEVPGALEQGSMINFQLIQNHLKFEISVDELDKHGLRVSSRLLAVAHTVRKAPPQ